MAHMTMVPSTYHISINDVCNRGSFRLHILDNDYFTLFAVEIQSVIVHLRLKSNNVLQIYKPINVLPNFCLTIYIIRKAISQKILGMKGYIYTMSKAKLLIMNHVDHNGTSVSTYNEKHKIVITLKKSKSISQR